MRLTAFSRRALAIRREARDLPKQGWERVAENGGRLWELTRGARWGKVITDVRIAADGKSLWIKVGDPT